MQTQTKQRKGWQRARLAQGPATEFEALHVIRTTLAKAEDCHVRITNYRKNGEQFENLLTMRPVHDSNGVYRFCIGVQFEVTRDVSLKSRLAKLDKLIKLLPSTIEVASQASGRQFTVIETAEEKGAELATKLESALDGNTIGPAPDVPLMDAAYFAENHKTTTSELGVATLADRCPQIDALAQATGAALPWHCQFVA